MAYRGKPEAYNERMVKMKYTKEKLLEELEKLQKEIYGILQGP